VLLILLGAREPDAERHREHGEEQRRCDYANASDLGWRTMLAFSIVPRRSRCSPWCPVTSDQASLIRTSWPTIAANTDALTTNFYTYLFEIDDSAGRLFAGVDMTAQRTKLAQSLAVVVQWSMISIVYCRRWPR
jgi:Globin